MKKSFLVLILVLIAALMTCTLVACNTGGIGRCPNGHDWQDSDVLLEATCTTSGLMYNKCSVCGIKREVEIEPLWHDLQVVPGTSVSPTCENDGYTGEFICAHLGCSYIEHGISVPSIGHAYGQWISNGNGTHKRICANDNSHYETENCSGGTATCTKKAECTTCGGEYGSLSTNHTFDKKIAEDKFLATPANCTAKATYYYSCVCGTKGTETFEYGEKAPHDFSKETATDEYKNTDASCTAKATYFYSCVYCDLAGTETFEYGETAPHDYKNKVANDEYLSTPATCTEKALYFYSCDCGAHGTATFAAGETLPHTYDKKVVDDLYIATPATCLDLATYYKSCVCGHHDPETSSTFEGGEYGDHVYDQKVAEDRYLDKEATCTKPATYFYSCICELKGTDTFESGDPISHTFDQKVATDDHLKYAANCQDAAEYYWSCICGANGTETFFDGMPADHNYDREVATDQYRAEGATCTSQAKYYYSCVCGQAGTNTFSFGELALHTMTHTAAKAATCVAEGNVEYWTCSVCLLNYDKEQSGNVLNSVVTDIDENNHANLVVVPGCKPGCETVGYKDGEECTACGVTTVVREEIAATGHSYTTWTETKAPTCTEDGEEESECDNCQTFATRPIDATGHDYSTSIVTDPTCTVDGYTTHTCHCGDSYHDSIVPATGHDFATYTEKTPATCTEAGVEVSTCKNGCGETDERAIPATGHTPDKNVCACGHTLTVDEIVELATNLETGATLPGTYMLTGTVTKVNEAYNTKYSNVTITILIAGTEVEYKCYRLKGTGADVVAVGDTVTVSGNLTNYKGNVQFAEGCTIEALVLTEHQVTFDVYGYGTVTGIPSSLVERTQSFEFTTTANEGYEVDKVLATGATVTNEGNIYTVVVNGDANVEVYFKKAGQSSYQDDVTFTFGENGAAKHVDGNDIGTSKEYTQNGYTLKLENASKVYDGAFDLTGNSALKLGTGSVAGKFTFTVPENVKTVYINIAGYKKNIANVSLTGYETTISVGNKELQTELSEYGSYTELMVDTSVNKTVTLATLSGGYRAMIDSIVYVFDNSGIEEPCTHNYGVYVTTAPTCTEWGFDTASCTECGEPHKHNFVAPTGHSLVDVGEQAPTCTVDGHTAHKACENCDYTEGKETLSAPGHKFDKEVVDNKYLKDEATCIAHATYYYSCSCGEKGTDFFTDTEGQLKDHAYNKEVATADYLANSATCTSPATYYKSCVCGLASTTETFESGDPIAHTYDQEVASDAYLAFEATCTAKATYYKSCTCGEKGSETFEYGEMLAHTYDQEVADEKYLASEATCTEKATYYKSCVCEAKGSETFEYGEKLDHTYDQELATDDYLATEATCTARATYCYSCTCGATGAETFESGDMLDHTYTIWSVDIPATCTTDGKETSNCDKCGTPTEKVIEALKHVDQDNNNVCDRADCGVSLCESHTAGDEWKSDGENHWHLCTACGFPVEEAPHTYDKQVTEGYLATEATCTARATYYYSCVCGEKGSETFESGEMLDHTYDQEVASDAYLAFEATCTAKATYYKSCTCGVKGSETFEYGEFAEHVYNQKTVKDGYLKDEATCIAHATYYYSCSCGEKGTDFFTDTEGQLKDHAYNKEVATADYLANSATCTSPATYYKSCVCGLASTTETFESGEMLAHTYDQGVASDAYLATEATCTAKATYYKSCTCGEKGSETFEYGEMLAHTYDQEKVDVQYLKDDATCEAKATYYKSCTCGLASTTETFESGEMLAHTYDQGVASDAYLATEATCTAKATYYKSCTCGEKGSETFEYGEMLAHTYDQEKVDVQYLKDDATCEAKATYYKSCTCGVASTTDFFTDEDGAYGQHNFDDAVLNPAVPATCSKTGTLEYQVCNVCKGDFDASGNNLDDLTIAIDPSAHNFDSNNICQNKDEHNVVCGMKKGTVSVTMAEMAAKYGWGEVAGQGGALNAIVSMSTSFDDSAQYQNTGKYYTSDTTLRVYSSDGGKISITVIEECQLVSINLTGKSGSLSVALADGTALASGVTMNVSGTSVELTVTANCRVTAIEVVYAYRPCSTHSATAYDYDADEHWQECTVCGEKFNKGTHDYSIEHVYNDSTCVADGNEHYFECVCGRLVDENKENEVTIDDVKIASDPTKHSYTTWTTDVDATCDTDGSKSSTCDHCGIPTTEVILGGHYDNDSDKKCDRCGEDVCNHVWNDGVVTGLTCTTDGTKTYTCTVDGCGATKIETVTANGHDFVNNTCAACGIKSVTNTYVIGDYTAGTQYAVDEVHKLDNVVSVTTTECHFTSSLNIYSSSTHNGFAIIESKYVLTAFSFNAGYKVDVLNVYGSSNGTDWTLIEAVDITSTSYLDYTVDIAGTEYTYIKLDVEGTNQVRVKSFALSYNFIPCDDCTPNYVKQADGNEHWDVCSVCGSETAHSSHSLQHTAAKEATCQLEGNKEYWYCSECEMYLDKEADGNVCELADFTEEVNPNNHTYVDGTCACGHTGSATNEPITVTAETFTSTEGSLDSVVQFSTDKGGGTSTPALNSGEIRLYQNSVGTGGGQFIVQVPDGYRITSVTIGSSMGTSVAYTLEDSTTKSSTVSLAAGSNVTFDNLSCNIITIHCMGNSKTTRLYVNYISVTYEKI